VTAPYAPSWAPPPPPPTTRRSADLALLLGLLSLPFTLFTGIPAVVFGVKALRVADAVGGRGRAWTGIVLGSVMTVLPLVAAGLLVARVVDGARVTSPPRPAAHAPRSGTPGGPPSTTPPWCWPPACHWSAFRRRRG
jgi:hypothetical protein